MSNTIVELERQAEREFRQAYKNKPRAGRTMRLHYQWTLIKVRLIAEEVRQEKRVHRATASASAPIGHQTAEVA